MPGSLIGEKKVKMAGVKESLVLQVAYPSADEP
jgi:hypothetical protein